MKQTFCKLCGYVGGAGETDCPDCGAPLFTREAVAEEAPAKEVDIIRKTKDRPSHPRLRWAAGFLAVCLAVQGTGLWLTQRSKPQAWSYASLWGGGGLVTPQGVWWAEEAELFAVSANSGPQRVLVGWTNSDSEEMSQRVIYYYDGYTLEKTDWENANISEDGRALFYTTGVSDRGQSLKRRDLKTGREEELARAERLALNLIDSAGTACVYVAGSAETFDTQRAQILLWQASTETSRELERMVWALSRNGDNYLTDNISDGLRNGGVDSDDWYYRVVWGKRGEHTDIKSLDYLVDRDLTELLYRDEDGYWRYENEDGVKAELCDLPRMNDLWYLRSAGAYYYNTWPDRLTDRVYHANSRLYCLEEDLTVTDLTGDGATISDTVFNEETQTLYYCQTDTGKVGGALYRMEDPCSKRRKATLVVEKNVRAYAVSQDGSTLCVSVWEGAPVNAVIWKISVDGGPFRPLEHAKSVQSYGDRSVLPVNDGGCWYLASNTDLRRELWYRAPDGTETLKLAYTSPASSTLYDDPPETVTLPVMPTVTNLSLVSVGDGSQALVLVERAGGTSVLGLQGYLSAYSYGGLTRDMDYWLLEADGAMRELEVLTP